MRIRAGIGLVAASLCAGWLLSPGAVVAQAATYPSGPFDAPYGATYTKGTATFYNRAVGLVGEQKAVASSGCRATVADTYDSHDNPLGTSGTPFVCGASEKFTLTVGAEVAGGAAWVGVCLVDEDFKPLKCDAVLR
ncbi:hypothetical protein [Streptomyces sp. NPDC049040]|uniref:hypothetical protein n=1 Tax=Streptomyces sp. NPDC049040 TaxID=3365593 RepID=UPI003711CF3A